MPEENPPADAPTYVLIGQHYWGSGTTLAAAKARFRKEGGELGRGYLLLTFDAATKFLGVDNVGRYSWNGNPPEEQMVQPRKQKASVR